MKRASCLLLLLLLLTACSREAPAPPSLATAPAVAPATANYQPGEKHRQALALLSEKKNREAADLLEQVVAAEPNAAEAWNDLSYAQIKAYRYQAAIESARKALALNPQLIYAQYNLGDALLQTNDWREARPHLEASRAAQPDRPEPLYGLGLWHEKDGNLAVALGLLRQAAAMGYGPAQSRLAYVEQKSADDKAAADAQARFPNVPPEVLREALNTYGEGVTSRVLNVLALNTQGRTVWAVLRQSDQKGRRAISLQMRSEKSGLGGYIGTCVLYSGPVEQAPAEASIRLTALPAPEGAQHVLVNLPGQAVVCGDGEVLFSGAGPAQPAQGGLAAGSQLFRYAPELVKYLPEAEFNQWQALFTELSQAGYKVESTSELPAATGQGDPLGRGTPARLVAWPTQRQYQAVLSVAVKYEGEPVIVHQVEDVMFPDPYEVGIVHGGTRTFLAVATHQPGAPNGGDVVVLEWDGGAGAFRTFVHLRGDSAGFDETGLVTSFKKYRPEGGYDRYVTTYEWDEAKQEFAKKGTENVGHQ